LIRDLGSRNGVRVNGQLQEEATLQLGDELAIGPILFRLEEEAEQPATPIRPAAAPAASSSPAPVAKAAWDAREAPRSGRPESDIDLVPIDDI
jgi:pyruvate/2-oxoglutarate dehydrogenase complex dihydrolipoamide acyltransferase (E2) component